MSSTSTLRLRPTPQAEIPRNATWSWCVAKSHLERERHDFARSQLKSIEVYYMYEQNVKLMRKIEPSNFKGKRFGKVHSPTPQQIICPSYFNEELYEEYRQRKRSKKMYREVQNQKRYEKVIQNATKSAFEILSEVRISQINRRKEVEEGASNYVSEVIDQEKDEMKVELESQVQHHHEVISTLNHDQQLFEQKRQQQQQQYQLQLLQEQFILAEQQRQYEAQKQQEYQLQLLQHQQQEEYQKQLYLQHLQSQQFQAQQAHEQAQQAHQIQQAHQAHQIQPAQQAQQIQEPQQPQPQPSRQIRSGTRSRSNARSLGSAPLVMTSTPIAWVVAAAAKISSLQNTPKESFCPEVEMVDVFFQVPMVMEDDRMDLEVEIQDDDKMVIDEYETVKNDIDTDCVMMEIGSDSDSDDSMME